MITVEALGLGKRYGRNWALRDCEFSLPQGSVAALIGPNGAGKSTLLSLIVGLRQPTEGRLSIMDKALPKRRTPQDVSYLSQEKPLYAGLTVAEMLRAGRALNARWDPDYATSLVRAAEVPLESKIKNLSGGQRARVALALALGRRPRLLILDEPLANLDPLARQDVMSAITTEVKANGTTVIVSSHIVGELATFCDHLLLLRAGHMLLTGRVSDLLDTHRLVPRAPEQKVSVREAESVLSLEDLVLSRLRVERSAS